MVTEAELAGDFPVPLGECLPDTTLVIRDEEGRESDKGVLFIGMKYLFWLTYIWVNLHVCYNKLQPWELIIEERSKN